MNDPNNLTEEQIQYLLDYWDKMPDCLLRVKTDGQKRIITKLSDSINKEDE